MGELGWEYLLHRNLAYLYLKSGNFEQALNESEAGNSFYYKALVFIEMGKIDSAQTTANELKLRIEKSPYKKQIRYYHQLQGRIELKREKWHEAIENFQAALLLLPFEHLDILQFRGLCDQAMFLDPLALAYYQGGDLEKACETYEKITTLTYGRIGYGDIYAHSFYMLGKIYEEIGWKGKAIERYGEFIELWQDCDPQFQPVVAEAREKVVRLKGEKGKGNSEKGKVIGLISQKYFGL